MATLCDGVEGLDRGVIINSLEILYKLCQKDSNEDYVNKCLTLKFYETLCLYLSLNDIMLLIFTLEAIYALTSMGTRSCHLLMQVRGVVDQLVSLITVEAQAYGPDGCILMRVVETVPGNMLPMVAQNIANLQNVAVIQQQKVQPPVLTAAIPQQQSLNSDQQQKQQQQQQLPNSNVEQNIGSTIQPVQQVQVAVQQQQQLQVTSSAATTAPVVNTTQQNFTQDDEHYALAWLGATFERAAGVESRVEQQELYRMYLSHCQKSGKHSVVNHVQFPRLVRLIFSNNVGPVVVRRADGSGELPGLHYVAIRLRAQPLPIQGKLTVGSGSGNNATSQVAKIKVVDLKKLKKKITRLPSEQQLQTQPQPQTPTSTPTQQQQLMPEEQIKSEPMQLDGVEPQGIGIVSAESKSSPQLIVTSLATSATPTLTTVTSTKSFLSNNTQGTTPTPPPLQQQNQQQQQQQQQQMQIQVQTSTQQQQQPTSSLIKSLLANKVTQRQQKQKELTAASSLQTATHTNVIASSSINQQQHTPIKVTSTAISALVNNPLMQNASVKVGQTTIKPLNPQVSLEKKHLLESSSAPPPLAPLSGNNVVKDPSGRPVLIANQMLVEILDKKTGEPPIPSTIIKRKLDDGGNTTNNEAGGQTVKRLAYDANGSVVAVVSSTSGNNASSRDDVNQVTPSKNAANLYAEMAASILEDEDLEDIPTLMTHSTNAPIPIAAATPQTAPAPSVIAKTLPQQQQQQPILGIPESSAPQQSILIPANIQQTSSLQNVQRQLLFQTTPTQPHQQLKLTATTTSNTQQIPTAMATIKTEQGLQTVPVILQQKPVEQSQPQLLQQVIQQASSQPTHTTQYVLATNHQGQTYLVAQQTPQAPSCPVPTPPTQTVLVTQTPQQQSAGTKTIIILQQQALPPGQVTSAPQQILTTAAGGTQKMIMTTPQGQSVLVTQRSQPTSTTPTTTSTTPPTQIFINPQTGAATHIQHVPVSGANSAGPQLLQRQLIQATASQHHQQQQPQAATNTGQISPTLLSQLNHIPATIKLHQPNNVGVSASSVSTTSSTTISRLNKTVSLVQTPPPPPPPIQIPQLQQHSSIIQQHIISGPPEKRQVILTGGRAIEIKETIITQTPTQPPTQMQQCHLNSQTIITTTHPAPPKVNVQATAATPTVTTTLQSKPPTTAQVIVTQSPLTKKSVIQRPLLAAQSTSVIKTNQGPPALILATNNTAQDPPEASEVPKPTPVSTPPPRTPTPASVSTPTNLVQPAPQLSALDLNWLYICDWRNCPRRKFKSLSDLQHHACTVHCPDHLDSAAEIFCQWGIGPGLCDGIPRKRFSLMTHIIDRHLTLDSLRQAVQRRLSAGANNMQPTQPPVTIIRNMSDANATSQRGNSASPASSTSSSSSSLPATGSSALHAIKRHTADFVNSKELMDENEGPVTKSIRLTASLILRNLVTYTSTAKRALRRYEPHLANVALSNVESSGAISHILFELDN